VVEIGSYLGRGTVFFGLAMREVNPHGRVVAIDPHTGDRQQLEGLGTDRLATFDLFQQHCRAAGVVDMLDAPGVAASLEVADGWSDQVDLIYVDGWHSYAAVTADGEAWLPHLGDQGVVIFDDYAIYDEVREAIHELARPRALPLLGLGARSSGQRGGGRAATGTPRALMLSTGGLRRALGRRLAAASGR
jgi:hypothetical protein